MRMRMNIAVISAASVVVPSVAHAYIGPGVGLGVIGTALAFLAAIALAIVGFVWYPLKRVLKGRKLPRTSGQSTNMGVAEVANPVGSVTGQDDRV